MKPVRSLSFAVVLAVVILCASSVRAQVTFPGPELLGRPTSSSVTVNVVASAAIDAYFQYGTQPGNYTAQTSTVSAAANVPIVQVISGLQSNTPYYYRMVYRQSGTSTWINRDEHSFMTQRPPGSTFTFTVMGDSHINIVFGDPNTYRTALQNAANDHPDFHFDLGDTFAMDNVTAQSQAYDSYLAARSYFGLISHSAPIFLALGNHEEEEAWHLLDADTGNNPATSKPVFGANARKRYYLNPNPFLDSFYTGNTDTATGAAIGGDHLPEDYYAFEWGDALFVAIDPYWYTITKPFTGNTGGGESEDTGSGDRWDWTLGLTQYTWLTNTLANSHATYKFIFAHHGTGGTDDYIRSGAKGAPYVEWGGFNEDGITNAFGTRRAGWPMPVHQLLAQNHVTAFFHAHDHEYAYEKRDGVVYQLLPMPSDASYSYGSFQQYHETDPYTIRVLPNSGHLRVTVSPSNVTVDYVRAFLSGAGTNGEVAHSYTIPPPSGSATPPNITAVTATPGSGGTAAIKWTTDVASDSRVAYGTSTSLISSAYSSTLAASHSLTLSGLTTGATYYYQVASRDAAGNFSAAPATPGSFIAGGDTTPPTISAISATPSSTGATITWTTNEVSSSSVSYGTTTSLGSTATGAAGVTSHSVTLSGLAAGTTYYYKVTSADASNNSATSPTGTPASFTTTGGGSSVTAFPASTVIQSGTLRSGSAANLTADDNSYFEVNSTATFGMRTASAYASFTGVSKNLSNLKITYKGKNSVNSATQTIAIWRWTTNTWVQLDLRSVGTTEVQIANLAPSGALGNYVSSSGELRVRVQSTRASNFYSSWDLMQIVYTAP